MKKFAKITLFSGTSEKNVTLSWFVNSNMVKPEKSEHVQSVYHFKVSLRDQVRT